MTARTVLLTGATGYIGSHTWLALQAAGYRVVGADNFSNSSRQVLQRLKTLGGTEPVFEEIDVCDTAALHGVFERHSIDAAVHFAAFKAVGESVSKPLAYYQQHRLPAQPVRANAGAALPNAGVQLECHGVR